MGQETTGKVKSDAQKLVSDIEQYIRLEAVERLTMLASRIVVAVVSFVLGLCALIFVCLGLVKALTVATGDDMLSYWLVGGAVLLLLVFFCMFCTKYVENKMVKVLSSVLLGGTRLADVIGGKSAASKTSAEDIHNLAESLATELRDYDEEGGSQ